MKVLVATKCTQGDRANDFYRTLHGELLCFGMGELPNDPVQVCRHEILDGDCGCKRSMIGVETRKATTTFRVAEIEALERNVLRDIIHVSLVDAQLVSLFPSVEALDSHLTLHLNELTRVVENWRVGTILERRGDRFLPRR